MAKSAKKAVVEKPKDIKVVHDVHPGLYPPRPMTLEVRECATLGTLFADVYLNDVLFLREISRKVAECFVQQPWRYPNAFSDEAKLRTWMVEQWDGQVQKWMESEAGQ